VQPNHSLTVACMKRLSRPDSAQLDFDLVSLTRQIPFPMTCICSVLPKRDHSKFPHPCASCFVHRRFHKHCCCPLHRSATSSLTLFLAATSTSRVSTRRRPDRANRICSRADLFNPPWAVRWPWSYPYHVHAHRTR
jgi:hypothetical protein